MDPAHGGKYMRYNICGDEFEVSAKYVPPFRLIGRGAYGIVCSALNSETNEEVAIKKIGNAFNSKIEAKRILREIKILMHMDHDNVITIKDVIPPQRRDDFKDVYIVYERMDTDLHYIIRSHQPLSEAHCKLFLYQLLRGLKYIHSANVLHRDLKPANIFVNANCDLKLGDFGLARQFSEMDVLTEYVVTRWYRAPELLLNCSEYTAAVDVWSVGCILMELLNRETLFPGRDPSHQLRLITELVGSPEESDLGFLKNDNTRKYMLQQPRFQRQPIATLARYSHMSPGVVDLIERMLVFDPEKRITVEEALAHPYVAPFHAIIDEPLCRPPHFEFDFEKPSFGTDFMKKLIMMAAEEFNPTPVDMKQKST